MTTSRTRVLTVLTLLLPLGATGLALPSPASAASQPAGRMWSVSGEDNDALSYGLYYRDAGGATVTVENPDSVGVSALSASSDGSRVIYVRDSFDADREEVVVRDTSTQQVRVLESVPLDGDVFLGEPTLSPDGTAAVWESYDSASDALASRKAAVAGGAASTLVTELTPYAFLSNDAVLVQNRDGDPFSLPLAGGAPTSVPTLPVEALDATVSPAGDRIAFGLYDTTVAEGAPYEAAMVVAALSHVGDQWTVGTPVPLEENGYNEEPAFSPDGSSVTWNHNDGAFGQGDLWTAPANGTAPAEALANTIRDDIDVAFTALPSADTQAPAEPTALPFTPAGTRATIRWTLPVDTDGDLSGVNVYRRLLDSQGVPIGPATTPLRYVPSGSVAFIDTGLVQGSSYLYDIKAVDRSGNESVAASRNMSATGAGATVQDPTSRTTTRAPFLVRFATTNDPDVTYSVSYSTNNSPTFVPWVNAAGIQRTFTAAVPGNTYRFKVTATDQYQNSTAASLPTATAVVPLDQARAALSGGANLGRSDAWYGTVRSLSRTTDYARITVTGSRFQLVVERCPTCGVVNIYDGATYIGAVDTRASARQARVVVYTRTWSSIGNHTITLRPRATAGRPSVLLDGFAVRR